MTIIGNNAEPKSKLTMPYVDALMFCIGSQYMRNLAPATRLSIDRMPRHHTRAGAM